MSKEKAWYVVHTQTGHEDKVREKILLNIDIQGFADRVFQVLVRTDEVVEVRKNKNYYQVRGKKKEYKLELNKFCKKCGKSTKHKEGKA